MKKSLFLLSVIFVLVFNMAVMAQDEEDYERDIAELAFWGGVDVPFGDILEWSDSLGATVGYNFGFDLGYFFSPKIVSGMGFRFSEYSIENEETDLAADGLKHRSYNPHLYIKYILMPESDIVPYVKGNAGLTFLKFTTRVINDNGDRYRQLGYDPAFSFGIGAGVFKYTADYGGFFIEGNYNYVSSNSVSTEYEGQEYLFNDNLSSWEIHGGIRILIGSGE